MKIALSGTHSTGKTTFLNKLIEAISPVTPGRIGQLAPEAKKHGFPILKEHTFNSTLWIMATGIKLEEEAALKNSIILIDRPVMEAHAYLNAALKYRGESLKPQEEECLLAISKGYKFTYDLVIKTVVDETLPIASRVEKRDHDAEFRRLVDQEMDSLYSRIDLPVRYLKVDDDLVLHDVVEMIKRAQ